MNTVSVSHVESAPSPSRRTIDAPTRAFHWLLALSFVGAYASAESERWRLAHMTLGYTMLGLMGFRLVWFLMGPRPARWQAWRARWQAGKQAVVALASGTVRLPPLQSALQTLVLLAVLALSVLAPLSGHALDQEWWGDALEDLHEAAGEALLMLVLLHLAVVAVGAWVRSHNPLRMMVTGKVPGAGPDLVPRNRAWLGALLLVAVLAFWWTQWQSAPNASGPLDQIEWRESSTGTGHQATGRRHHHDDDDD